MLIHILDFERVKETLAHHIAVAIAFTAHTAPQSISLDNPLIRQS